MQHFPVFLDLKQRPCLVVGGGQAAERKVDLLLQAGTRITLAAPVLDPELSTLWQKQQMHFHPGVFSPELLKDKVLVTAASDDRNVSAGLKQGLVMVMV